MATKEAAPLAQTEDELVATSIDWVADQCPDGACPFDGARSNHDTDAAAAQKALRQHLKARHQFACVSAYQQKTLSPNLAAPPPQVEEEESVEDGDFWAMGGFQRVDEIDRPNALYVANHLNKRARGEGASLRWASPDRVARYRDMGAVAVPLKESIDPGMRQGSTEDGVVKSNEMVLMYFPPQLTEKRRRQKARLIEKSLYARKEDMNNIREGAAKKIMDEMTKRGIDTETASQVARAITKGAETGTSGFVGKDARAHEGIHLEDQTGKKRLD